MLVATKMLTAEFHSLYVKEGEPDFLERSEAVVGVGSFGKVGLGHFTSDCATLAHIGSQPFWNLPQN